MNNLKIKFIMKQFFLQLAAILIYKTTKYQTATFKEMKAEYKRREEEFRKKAERLQAELDAEHRTRFGWDSTTVNPDYKAIKA